MNTENTQNVELIGDSIFVRSPRNQMTKEEAVRHACWLLVKARPDRTDFLCQMAATELARRLEG